MGAKPKSKKNAGSTRRIVDAGDKDQLIIEQKNRIEVLENELRLKQDNITSREITELKRADMLDQALNHINGLINSTLDFDLVMRRVISEACVAIGSETAAISLRKENQWVVSYVHGIDSVLGSVMDDEQEPHAVLAIRTKKPVVVDDAFNDERTNREHMKKWGVRSVIVVPLIAEDEVIGVIFFNHHKQAVHFTQSRANFAEQLASSISLALHNARLFDRLRAELDERKRAEEELRESEEKFVLALKNSGTVLFHQDRELRYTWVHNPHPGFSNVEVIGKTDTDLLPHDESRLVAIKRQVLETGAGKREEVRTTIGGVPFYYDLTVEPLLDDEGKTVGIMGASHDITERKRVDEALRESEERYKLVVAGARGAIWDWDVPNKRVFFSPQWKALRGLADDEVTDSEGEWGSRIHPEDAPRVIAAVQAHFEGKTPVFSEEYRTRCKDGSWKWISDRGMARRDAAGRVIRMAGSEHDITERKRAEIARRDALVEASRFRHAVEHVPAYVYMKDLQFRYIYANQPTLELFGCSAEGLVGTDDSRFFPPETVERLREVDLRVFAGERTYEEIDVPDTGSGRRVYLEIKTPIYEDLDGKRISGLLGISTDISERKRVEEALRETRDYLENLINYANAPIIVWDLEFAITQFNHAFERLSGYNAKEVVGKNLKLLFPPDSIDESLDKIRSTLTGERWESVEIPILRKDGSTRIALWNSANVHGEHGELRATIAQGQDITERKRAEKELSDTKSQVELYLDLMGHDINNMNMVASGFIELARAVVDNDGKLDSSNVDLLESAMASINNSSRLIGNVRKLQRGRMGEYKPEVYDLGALVGEVCEQFRSAPDRDVSISCGAIKGVRVQANELLRDVFINLIGNAIKHSRGPTQINIKMMPKTINDNLRYCTVTIEDNGRGIPDTMKSVIFDRFRRGDTKAHGTGLGLYLVKTLVDSYGGKVWVEDRVKGDYTKGSRFVVMLPTIEK